MFYSWPCANFSKQSSHAHSFECVLTGDMMRKSSTANFLKMSSKISAPGIQISVCNSTKTFFKVSLHSWNTPHLRISKQLKFLLFENFKQQWHLLGFFAPQVHHTSSIQTFSITSTLYPLVHISTPWNLNLLSKFHLCTYSFQCIYKF